MENVSLPKNKIKSCNSFQQLVVLSSNSLTPQHTSKLYNCRFLTQIAPLYSTPEFHKRSRTLSFRAYTLMATAPIRSPSTSSPLTSKTQSPTRRPALSAADPASTSLTHGYGSHWVRLRWKPQEPLGGRVTTHWRNDGSYSSVDPIQTAGRDTALLARVRVGSRLTPATVPTPLPEEPRPSSSIGRTRSVQ